MKTTIYLIRHAESVANKAGIFRGVTDDPLSENGRQQAEDLANRLSNVRVDAIYASILQRASQTIMPFAKRRNKEITIEKGLQEIFVGTWENVMYNELKVKFPKVTKYIEETGFHTGIEGQEETENVASRMLKSLERISKKNIGKTIIVVSHHQSIRAFLCKIEKILYEQIMQKIGDIPNTGITEVEYDAKSKKFLLKGLGMMKVDKND